MDATPDNAPKGQANSYAGGVVDSIPTSLAQMVEAEIIPRLLLAHRHPAAAPAGLLALQQSAIAIDIAHFATQALDQDTFTLLALLEQQRANGVPIETLFLDLVAPAARQLGVWWEQDVCDFVDVTMGLWRLQEAVHELAARVPGAAEGNTSERRAFFSTLPDSQHGFGTRMVEEFFRRAGWSTWSATDPTSEELVRLVGGRWFDIIGLTASTEADLAALPGVIRQLRAASRNPDVAIMAGGWIFAQTPALATELGADGTAPDARSAVAQAEFLVAGRIAASQPGRI